MQRWALACLLCLLLGGVFGHETLEESSLRKSLNELSKEIEELKRQQAQLQSVLDAAPVQHREARDKPEEVHTRLIYDMTVGTGEGKRSLRYEDVYDSRNELESDRPHLLQYLKGKGQQFASAVKEGVGKAVGKGEDLLYRAEAGGKRFANAAKEKLESVGDSVKEVVKEGADKGQSILSRAKEGGLNLAEAAKEKGKKILDKKNELAWAWKEELEDFYRYLLRSFRYLTWQTEERKKMRPVGMLPAREVGPVVIERHFPGEASWWRS